ncbi:phosphotransferase [Streptomyces sp. 549]|uniref:phosphotransferase enzyme family protein n=1 Tax=Streptomyces sp. 549 TaxID=3049076 RepID=UPI0024C3EE85|nr:phosphotransferase [Streptomyces sp. 549]MDK1473194.1 phosphotransferase [Streptomyces sp. 549]
MRRFHAGEPLSCEPLTQGLLNRGYRISTTRGLFFLKHHLDGDPEAIDRQHRATRRLDALGVPVVPPVPTGDGRTVAVVGGGCFALHPWVQGRHRDGGELTCGQSRRLGALLGLVHVRLEQVIPQSPGPGGDPHPSADPEQTHRLIDELLARVRTRRSPDPFDALAEHRLTERRRLLREHGHRRPAAGTEPVAGWVHGDFHPLNLLYRDEAPYEPLAIVDWDRLAVQPRAEEAVRAAAIFFVRPDGRLELDKVRRYARAYRRAAGADVGELAAAVHRVWWERLNDFWMLRWRYQLRDRRADPQFPAAAALVVWWTREYDQVLAAFCD